MKQRKATPLVLLLRGNCLSEKTNVWTYFASSSPSTSIIFPKGSHNFSHFVESLANYFSLTGHWSLTTSHCLNFVINQFCDAIGSFNFDRPPTPGASHMVCKCRRGISSLSRIVSSLRSSSSKCLTNALSRFLGVIQFHLPISNSRVSTDDKSAVVLNFYTVFKQSHRRRYRPFVR